MKIPSMRAARIIAIVRIGPDAPGLRPVASAAFDPSRPIPSPPPSAAAPTRIAFASVIMLY